MKKKWFITSLICAVALCLSVGLGILLPRTTKADDLATLEVTEEETATTITGANIASGSEKGGALYLTKGATYTMKNGVIKNVKKKYGGAVYVSSGCEFILDGGTIKNCAAKYGGAIYIEKGGKCTIKSGKIDFNGAEVSPSIHVEPGAELIVEDFSVISNNYELMWDTYDLTLNYRNRLNNEVETVTHNVRKINIDDSKISFFDFDLKKTVSYECSADKYWFQFNKFYNAKGQALNNGVITLEDNEEITVNYIEEDSVNISVFVNNSQEDYSLPGSAEINVKNKTLEIETAFNKFTQFTYEDIAGYLFTKWEHNSFGELENTQTGEDENGNLIPPPYVASDFGDGLIRANKNAVVKLYLTPASTNPDEILYFPDGTSYIVSNTNKTITINDVTYCFETTSDYRFDSWLINSSAQLEDGEREILGETIIKAQLTPLYKIYIYKNDSTRYGVFTKPKGTLIEANGNTIVVDGKSYKAVVDDGYVFDYWYVGSNNTNVFTSVELNKNITLKPKTSKVYTVSVEGFVLNGGVQVREGSKFVVGYSSWSGNPHIALLLKNADGTFTEEIEDYQVTYDESGKWHLNGWYDTISESYLRPNDDGSDCVYEINNNYNIIIDEYKEFNIYIFDFSSSSKSFYTNEILSTSSEEYVDSCFIKCGYALFDYYSDDVMFDFEANSYGDYSGYYSYYTTSLNMFSYDGITKTNIATVSNDSLESFNEKLTGENGDIYIYANLMANINNGFFTYGYGDKNNSSVLAWYNGSQKSITIPDQITTINGSAFYLSSVTSVDFNNVTTIKSGAFMGSSVSGELDLSGVSEIGDHAFADCFNLKGVILNTTNIGEYAFSSSGLIAVYLGTNQIYQNSDTMFMWCYDLECVAVDVMYDSWHGSSFSIAENASAEIYTNSSYSNSSDDYVEFLSDAGYDSVLSD